ncbi:hypothetical protein PhaeoP128_03285 [Phaeobacter gallaeciensis]|nr:hypothetical protein PhaeoP129_03284 [Phaeobacter gallaeciensis]ATF23991.1 hypothetical protein PhaeoP128_03285 [Phaeobacter gallaeciensis]
MQSAWGQPSRTGNNAALLSNITARNYLWLLNILQ